ncbi:class D sortase [Alteribacillus bidgolensis]|uniref:Sortase A n=1 Tax=Alteribacillus bidgolensis TaxID=930129 RepID=A0A1G8L533_9BACI|nr:class D sortase [Alteribacillus bidgolensis]SDI50711.1 sortase A [Alteribacillus bidgolensis]
MKTAAVIIFLAGVFVFLYPEIEEYTTDSEQKQLMDDWDKEQIAPSEIDVNNDVKERYMELNNIFDRDEENPAVEDESDESSDQKNHSRPSTIGVLRIPAIDAELPVVEGATEENLRTAAGHLEGTALLGKKGNSAIAAHRSHTHGRMFNRLDEVEDGDDIVIEDETGEKTYSVFNKTVVSPNDTSVLTQDTDGEAIVTLITCTPMKNPTHRLIVQGKYKE